MLLTNTLPIFSSQWHILSYHLKNMIKNNAVLECFEEDFCEFISEFYESLNNNNLTYTTKIVEQFYAKWIDSSQFPDPLKATIDKTITALLTPFIIYHLSAELSFISHYSLAISSSLTLLFISIGIKITTPEWSSIGMLSGGMFKYKIYKTSPALKHAKRIYKY